MFMRILTWYIGLFCRTINYLQALTSPSPILFCAELVSSPHYEPLTTIALCLFPKLLNSSQRCVLRAIFTNDFCPRCCVWRTSATRTFMGSDFLHSGTFMRTSQTQNGVAYEVWSRNISLEDWGVTNYTNATYLSQASFLPHSYF